MLHGDLGGSRKGGEEVDRADRGSVGGSRFGDARVANDPRFADAAFVDPAFAAAEGEVGGGGEKKSSDTKETKEKARPVPVAKKDLAVLPTDVSRLQMKVGTITNVWQHPDAEKLFVELIDVGDAGGPRQVVSGLVGHVSLDAMLGKKVLVVANMKPAKIRGVESQGMVLAASKGESLRLVTVDGELSSGASVK